MSIDIDMILVRSAQALGRRYTPDEEAFVRSSAIKLRAGDYEVVDTFTDMGSAGEYVSTLVRGGPTTPFGRAGARSGRHDHGRPRLSALRERLRKLDDRVHVRD